MTKKTRLCLALALLAVAVPTAARAAIEAVTSVETERKTFLTNITVGDYTVTADSLVTGKSKGKAVWPTAIALADNLDLNIVNWTILALCCLFVRSPMHLVRLIGAASGAAGIRDRAVSGCA